MNEPVDPVQLVREAVMIVEQLVAINVARMAFDLSIPKLYESGVRYDRSFGEPVLTPCNLIVESGVADVTSLVAWRIAELQRTGETATCAVQWMRQGASGRLYMTLRVRRSDGTLEDVLAELEKSAKAREASRSDLSRSLLRDGERDGT